MICVLELYNKETLEHEVLAYLTEDNNERYIKLNERLQKTITPTEREKYTLRWNYFDSDWDDDEIIMEALNAIRE
jgi:hypothetical protein